MTTYMRSTVNVPPFPVLSWNGASWEGQVVLPAWKGFPVRLGPYGTPTAAETSDGNVRLHVAPPDGDGRPSNDQVAAFRFLQDHDATVRDNILRAIYVNYPALQNEYGYDTDEAAALMPDLAAPADLRRLIALLTLHIHKSTWDGAAYVGFEFGCTWDGEHGLGVLTHRGRMVEVGGAEVSFEEWIAKRDLDSTNE